MIPSDFLDEVAQPNMQTALERPDCLRSVVNAILTLDALAGIIHACTPSAGTASVAKFEDDRYRDELARVSSSYRVLRDAAVAIKHGERSPMRKKVRLIRGAQAFKIVPNGLGLLQCGDRLGSDVVIIEFDPGPGYVRATDVIADSYRMLKRVVEGRAALTDEHDRGTLVPTDAMHR